MRLACSWPAHPLTIASSKFPWSAQISCHVVERNQNVWVTVVDICLFVDGAPLSNGSAGVPRCCTKRAVALIEGQKLSPSIEQLRFFMTEQAKSLTVLVTPWVTQSRPVFFMSSKIAIRWSSLSANAYSQSMFASFAHTLCTAPRLRCRLRQNMTVFRRHQR